MSISPCHLSQFSPEFQLACLCCRYPLTDADRAEITRLLAAVDVPAFIDLVIARHRIGPLVHSVLGQLSTAVMPPELMEALSACARENAVNALRSMRALILLARWFADAGIEWLPFKGITVAQRYYGDFAVRQVNDIDVWVPGSKRFEAREVLKSHGFQLCAGNEHGGLAGRGPRHRAYLNRYYFEDQLYSKEFGGLELHWRLTGNLEQFKLAPEQILDRADMLALGSSTVRVMGDVDLLLYLCEHGGRHGWYRLKWLADLPRLLVHREWDWPRVVEMARSAGSLRTLLLGLGLCRDLFGWTPPETVDREIRSFMLLPLASRTVRLDLKAPISELVPVVRPSMTRRFVDVLRGVVLSTSPKAASGNLWRYSLSPNDLEVVRLPDRWFGLYYLLRPILFIVRILREARLRQAA